jgi:hypothetical protein
MARHGVRPLVLALVAALALGLAGRVAVHGSNGAFAAAGHAALALGAPWLVVAWLVGACVGARAAGALAGGFALALGTTSWYLLTVAGGGWAAVYYAFPVAPAWALVAAGAGAAFGAAGAAWRSGRVLALALPAGALAGEALLLAGEWGGRAARAVVTLELALGVALVVVASRRRRPAVVVAAAAAAVAFAVGEGAVRDALRGAGWLGR